MTPKYVGFCFVSNCVVFCLSKCVVFVLSKYVGFCFVSNCVVFVLNRCFVSCFE